MPLEPLPPEWHDGTEVTVEAVREQDHDAEEFALAAADREANEWFHEMEAAVTRVDPNDAAVIEAAIRAADSLAKQQIHREMGLP
jgi:hypothetical protein